MKILDSLKVPVVLFCSLFLSNVLLYGQNDVDNDYPYCYRPNTLINVPLLPYSINKNDDLQLSLERSKNVDLVGRGLYGRSDGVFVEGNYLYVTAGSALLIYDISSPSNPILVGHIYVPGLIYGSYIPHIYVSKGYAYIAAVRDGLRVINVSEPTHPVEVSQLVTPGSARGVCVRDSIAYIGDSEEGLRIINISKPSKPVEIGYYKSVNYAVFSVWIFGNYAYITTTLGLRIIDISNPISPIEVGQYNETGPTLQVFDNIAFFATDSKGLLILDVTKPNNVIQVGQFLPNPTSNNNLVASLFISDRYAYIATLSTRLIIVDIFDFAHPIEVGRFNYMSSGSWSLAYSNFYVFAGGDSYLQSINVSDTNNPTNGSLSYTGDWSINVTAAGSFAYVSNFWVGGLRIIDISNPSIPKEIATYWDSTGLARKFTTSSLIVDTLAYICIQGIGGGGELRIVSVKDPKHPYLIGKYSDTTREFAAGEMVIKDTLAYITDYSSGLWILNVKDANQPKYLGHYKSMVKEAFTYGLKVFGNYAYVAAFRAGLLIIDISDPTNPKLAAKSIGLGGAIDVDVYGNYAYVTDGFYSQKKGLRIINISNPQNPIEESFYDFPEILLPLGYRKPDCFGVKILWPYAYVGANWAGLRIIDISNPKIPKEVGFYNTDNNARGIGLYNGLIFVADEWDGLYILRSHLATAVDDEIKKEIPSKFTLSQNYPNPFNPATNINYFLPTSSFVSLRIYNVLGQEIRILINENQQAGEHMSHWDGKDNFGKTVTSGVYFYRIDAGTNSLTKKMIVLR